MWKPQVSADHRVDGRWGWASTIAGPLDGARASERTAMKNREDFNDFNGNYISY